MKILGIVFICAGWLAIIGTKLLLRFGVSTEAKIVAIEKQPGRSTHSLYIEFSTPTRPLKTYRYMSGNSAYPKFFSVGQTVQIVYVKNHPAIFEVKDNQYLYTLPLIFIGIGFVLLALHIFVPEFRQ